MVRPITVLTGHEEPVDFVAFSPASDRLVSIGNRRDGDAAYARIAVWSGFHRCEAPFASPWPAEGVDVDADGESIRTLDRSSLSRWDRETGALREATRRRPSVPTAIAHGAAGRYEALVFADSWRLLDRARGAEERVVRTPFLSRLEFSSDDRWVAEIREGPDDSFVRLRDMTHPELAVRHSVDGARDATFYGVAQRVEVALAEGSKGITIRNPETGVVVRTLRIGPSGAEAVRASTEARVLAGAFGGGVLAAWDLDSGRLLGQADVSDGSGGSGAALLALVGDQIAYGRTGDLAVRWIDARSGRLVTVTRLPAPLFAMTSADDGETIAWSTRDLVEVFRPALALRPRHEIVREVERRTSLRLLGARFGVLPAAVDDSSGVARQ